MASASRITRIGLAMMCLAMLANGCAAPEPPPTSAARSYRVGFLGSGERQEWHSELVSALGKYGYREGQNLTMEYRYAHGRPDDLPGLAQELVDLGVNALVAADTGSAQAAKSVSANIPIVIAVGADPLKAGLAKQISRPGWNVTGLVNSNTELSGKRVEVLQDLIPGLSRVAVLSQTDKEDGSFTLTLKETVAAAEQLGLTASTGTYATACDIPSLFDDAVSSGAQGVVLVAGPVLGRYSGWVAQEAVASGLPVIYSQDVMVTAGGLSSYTVSLPELYRRAAGFVDQILRGADPAAIPFEFADRWELKINGRAAHAIGLPLGPSVLSRADQVLDVDWDGHEPPPCGG